MMPVAHKEPQPRLPLEWWPKLAKKYASMRIDKDLMHFNKEN
jgi:hypothetical protein